MPKKGCISNNPSGRPAGIPNKITTEIRGSLRDAMQGHVESLAELLLQLEPKDRIDAIAKLLCYVIPRFTDAHVTGALELSAKSRQELSRLEDLDIKDAEFTDDG